MNFQGVTIVSKEGVINKIPYKVIEEDLDIKLSTNDLWHMKNKNSIYKDIVAICSDFRKENYLEGLYTVELYFKFTDKPVIIENIKKTNINVKNNVEDGIIDVEIKNIELHYNKEYLQAVFVKKQTKNKQKTISNKALISLRDSKHLLKIENITKKIKKDYGSGINVSLTNLDNEFYATKLNFYSLLYSQEIKSLEKTDVLVLNFEKEKEIIIKNIDKEDFKIEYNSSKNNIEFYSYKEYFKYSIITNDIVSAKLYTKKEYEDYNLTKDYKNLFIKNI